MAGKIVNERKFNLKEILMKHMKPLQIAMVIDKNCEEYGSVVMRTASTDKFEVMNLGCIEEDQCWTGGRTEIKVRLLDASEKITVEFYNE